MTAIVTAIMLATLVKAVSDLLLQPVTRRYPDIDLWWWDYVSFVAGALVAWLAGINLLSGYMADPMIGRVLTALVVGGGVPLINQLFGPIQGREPYTVVTTQKPVAGAEESVAGDVQADVVEFGYRGW